MTTEEEGFGMSSSPSCLHMISAFLAMEPPDVVLSFARDFGGGSINDRVQSCIWHRCICKADVKWQGSYLKRFLKKLILEIESSGGVVLDELYEQYASYMTSVQDDDAAKGNSRILKCISFIFSDETSAIISCPKSRKLEVQLQCSLNMLEGDTGCSIWPSSIFLSEFILSFPEIFTNKCCFEVGSGVGLVGICLAHVKASKVILSDGDFSTLANMKVNLELNHLSTKTHILDNPVDPNTVHCVCLPWESASEDDLCNFAPDIILGADVIYDPSCLPHLVRVLASLLKHESSSRGEDSFGHESDTFQEKVISNGSPIAEVLDHPAAKGPIAYVASVIRNIETFNSFLALAEQANLIVADLTEKSKEFGNSGPKSKRVQLSKIRVRIAEIQARTGRQQRRWNPSSQSNSKRRGLGEPKPYRCDLNRVKVKMSEEGREKSRGVSAAAGEHSSTLPPNYYYGTFQGVANYQPQPPLSQPVVGFPQPVPPAGFSGSSPQYYHHGYQTVAGYAVVEGRPFREDRLPCCGIGIGWILFISGFFLGAIPWYVGAFLLLCVRLDYREKPGLFACTLAAILAAIAITLGVTRVAHLR